MVYTSNSPIESLGADGMSLHLTQTKCSLTLRLVQHTWLQGVSHVT